VLIYWMGPKIHSMDGTREVGALGKVRTTGHAGPEEHGTSRTVAYCASDMRSTAQLSLRESGNSGAVISGCDHDPVKPF